MSDFNIDAVIQSQYGDSPHIKGVIRGYYDYISPQKDIDLIYDKMINIYTAEGYGLDVWGRIVNIDREFVAVDEQYDYLGFDNSPYNMDRIETFNNAPFYKVVNGRIRLEDNAYRTYILIKALINISNVSLNSLNYIFSQLFPDTDIKVLHSNTMILRLLVIGAISQAQIGAIKNIEWLPAGVGLQFYHIITPTFGFRGSGLETFNNGTFGTYGIENL
ncbi:DUF2612 domain-containing protein [Succinivibrio sp.]|uniref:DUF2612 domain-containing protein n=1 Tax=Succinivibrio sp. TaxID=2053619 RepID=UPI003867D34C